MIIKHFTDNDLYKFSVMLAIQRLYPWAYVRYEFMNRGGTLFPKGFAERLREEVKALSSLRMTKEEKAYISKRCYFFDPVFIDFLEGYRYNPDEVHITQDEEGHLEVMVEGYWYRTVLWEVPLMAIISELYFQMMGVSPQDAEKKAVDKALQLKELNADFSDFGTRRRFSYDVHDKVISSFKAHGGAQFKGTSNIYLAMKYDTTPIGTMPHEWFMYHGALFGYRIANMKALEAWVDVYQGSLGITLTDTYTTDAFYQSFSLKQAKLFDGVRWDSGDPLSFTDKTIRFYEEMRIDPLSKTIVYSDSLNLERVKEIKQYVNGRIHDAYGIGTYFTNDVGASPLNMVIKLTEVKQDMNHHFRHAVKLSDTPGKHTGNLKEIKLCKQTLSID
ncbi:nicotinate phosphoribosyltransferase [Parabacteroides sp. PF5-5]|uniref:nicotinate phosphoribosyltransferase n=1 Tax=unclassified Parabacteroides TaxID=2649774 RepID=UPI00247479A5|nr:MULTISPECIES: nicotinate phosphoribosyltransferase [unclassified Parabacteroides]MDH6305022.1 nicotinate phosphoribosyltransferase [Parabacteroides sp. PH5-39]MDH6315893.1 nicotinate phosphoribosyltransferase [Parabacteroides sp. PF5-13]MDH6319550.1 nicotinate phosphoribosyltransferase [Parabacteroides sp. PH5-13]MDH6323281.1 nicotinate phosphoribosyltransferase [Parabacteroides sp. PH5-8]MDH6327211.1 nicotinate phosphoribosyltransferase [Parabacteroides sp. PH5-41]